MLLDIWLSTLQTGSVRLAVKDFRKQTFISVSRADFQPTFRGFFPSFIGGLLAVFKKNRLKKVSKKSSEELVSCACLRGSTIHKRSIHKGSGLKWSASANTVVLENLAIFSARQVCASSNDSRWSQIVSTSSDRPFSTQ